MSRRWTGGGRGALIAMIGLFVAGPALAQGLCDSDPELSIVNVDSDITTDTTWTRDNVYVLGDVIYVRNGANLTIEKGTVIRGRPDSATPLTPNNPGTLVITRDSRIYALGTARAPITFTDCGNDNVRDLRPGTFPYDDLANALGEVGNWGGLILLGRAYVANNTSGGPNPAREVLIEGLVANGECSNAPSINCTINADCGAGNTCEGIGRGFYGNCSAVYDTTGDPCICDDDGSGVLNYVSISFSGFNLSANNEINGLTLGAVGRETDIDHVEVFQSKDDGLEFFGGAVNVKHALVANNGDDGFDSDEGYRGKLQYLFLMQGKPGTDQGDKGGEHDGGNSPDASRPLAIPTVYNATYIGLGPGGGSGNSVVHFRDNTGFRYYNSAFLDFRGAEGLVEGATDGTFPRDPALGTAAGTSGERAITAFPPGGTDAACLYSDLPASATQLEMRDNTWWCIGRQEDPALRGTMPTVGYCSNDVTQTRNCLDNADCGAGTCLDKPLDYHATSADVAKVHYNPGWLALANTFNNQYLGCGATLPIRTLVRDGTLANQAVSVNPLPTAASPLLSTARTAPDDGFFDPVSYRGAFRDENWAAGWTQLWRFGYFADNTCDPFDTPICSDAPARVLIDADITTDTTWTRDQVYVLGDVIYVRNGATLTIEPGTVVRGAPDSFTPLVPNNPGTLVITRDSKIFANGTADRPITFTDSLNDNVLSFGGTFPYSRLEDSLGEVGNWGGVILLGRAYVANNTSGGPNPAREVLIEGLVANGECSNDPSINCTINADCGAGNTCEGIGRGFYGNCSAVYDTTGDPCICDDDDSGSLRYVTISHGGFNLSANNEINGLTLGAIGRETDIDYVEVFQSKDDGLEFFGGTVGVQHAVVANNGDDGFDSDEGFRGDLQYLFLMQGKPGTDQGDKGGEHDGGNSPDASRPLAIPTIYNATYIGLGQGGGSGNTALHFRDNTGFRYYNSAFLDFRGAEALVEGATDGTFPRDPALGTAANTSGERAITAFPPGGTEAACFYPMASSAFQLEMRENTWWCIGRQENPNFQGTLPTVGYCSNDVTQTRNCLDNADCGAGTCLDKPLDYHATSADVAKVHYNPGWLAPANPFGNQYLACAAGLPIRQLDRDAALGFQTVAVDPRPAPGSPLLTTSARAADPGVTPASFRGAFNTTNWASGWTQLWRTRYVAECGLGGGGTAVPDEVGELAFRGKDELRWAAVGDAVTYDVLRSLTPGSFALAVSIESEPPGNVHNLKADAAANPGPNETYYFVVRAQNDCGDGSIGTLSSGVERTTP